jgi:hypothetical protein
MRRTAIWMTLALATIALAACTPFVYGGVVVFGPAENQTAAKENAPGTT